MGHSTRSPKSSSISIGVRKPRGNKAGSDKAMLPPCSHAAESASLADGLVPAEFADVSAVHVAWYLAHQADLSETG